jgi:hypothetical protein
VAALHSAVSRVLDALVLDGDDLRIPDDTLVELAAHIQPLHGDDVLTAELTALARRLSATPNTQYASEQIVALAAVLLGDVRLNGALCRWIYGKRSSGDKLMGRTTTVPEEPVPAGQRQSPMSLLLGVKRS